MGRDFAAHAYSKGPGCRGGVAPVGLRGWRVRTHLGLWRLWLGPRGQRAGPTWWAGPTCRGVAEQRLGSHSLFSRSFCAEGSWRLGARTPRPEPPDCPSSEGAGEDREGSGLGLCPAVPRARPDPGLVFPQPPDDRPRAPPGLLRGPRQRLRGRRPRQGPACGRGSGLRPPAERSQRAGAQVRGPGAPGEGRAAVSRVRGEAGRLSVALRIPGAWPRRWAPLHPAPAGSGPGRAPGLLRGSAQTLVLAPTGSASP